MYNSNGVGVVKLCEDGMGFIVATIVIGMITILLFKTLTSAGKQVMMLKEMLLGIKNTDCSKASRNI